MRVALAKRISTALGLLALAAAPSLAGPPSRNQATADAVAGNLRTVPGLAGSPVQIEAREGIVTLSGRVASPGLKAVAVARAQQIPGVAGVVDQLSVTPDVSVQPAQYQPTQVAMGGGHMFGHGGGTVMNGTVVGDAGAYAGAATVDPSTMGGPLPEGAAVPGAGTAGQPGMPNYAWPSYAPAGNFSAVGYPTVYPWQAWPNIGPFYPYPEVPLDWRAVTLRWDDGLWWLDFKKHYTRPFFTPYPFGIFGY
jgi:hypothetical protein